MSRSLINTKNAAETRNAGKVLASALTEGDIVALCGNLGAGKTAFTQGIVEGLGGLANDVSSPTFALVNEYNAGSLTVYHFDVYRLCGVDTAELDWMDDYLFADNAVCVIEWAEYAKAVLPDNTIWADIKILGDNEREIRII